MPANLRLGCGCRRKCCCGKTKEPTPKPGGNLFQSAGRGQPPLHMPEETPFIPTRYRMGARQPPVPFFIEARWQYGTTGVKLPNHLEDLRIGARNVPFEGQYFDYQAIDDLARDENGTLLPNQYASTSGAVWGDGIVNTSQSLNDTRYKQTLTTPGLDALHASGRRYRPFAETLISPTKLLTVGVIEAVNPTYEYTGRNGQTVRGAWRPDGNDAHAIVTYEHPDVGGAVELVARLPLYGGEGTRLVPPQAVVVDGQQINMLFGYPNKRTYYVTATASGFSVAELPGADTHRVGSMRYGVSGAFYLAWVTELPYYDTQGQYTGSQYRKLLKKISPSGVTNLVDTIDDTPQTIPGLLAQIPEAYTNFTPPSYSYNTAEQFPAQSTIMPTPHGWAGVTATYSMERTGVNNFPVYLLNFMDASRPAWNGGQAFTDTLEVVAACYIQGQTLTYPPRTLEFYELAPTSFSVELQFAEGWTGPRPAATIQGMPLSQPLDTPWEEWIKRGGARIYLPAGVASFTLVFNFDQPIPARGRESLHLYGGHKGFDNAGSAMFEDVYDMSTPSGGDASVYGQYTGLWAVMDGRRAFPVRVPVNEFNRPHVFRLVQARLRGWKATT